MDSGVKGMHGVSGVVDDLVKSVVSENHYFGNVFFQIVSLSVKSSDHAQSGRSQA